MPETSSAHKHHLVVIVSLQSCGRCFQQDQTAQIAAKVLLSHAFTVFRSPTVIHSDHGRELKTEVCNLVGIHKSPTTAYHSLCDGRVMRENRNLQDML